MNRPAAGREDSSGCQFKVEFIEGRQKTFIGKQFSSYPFHLCRPLYLDARTPEIATIYLQSSAGGVFSGDDLSMQIYAGPSAKAHMTTQASTVVHRMRQGNAMLRVNIDLAEHSMLEYLPDPLILFPEANLMSRLELIIEPSATAILCDSFLMHDPDCLNRRFTTYQSETIVRSSSGELLCCDRFSVSGDDFGNGKPGIMGNARAMGTFFLIRPQSDFDQRNEVLRHSVRSSEAYVGISTLPNKIGSWARIIAADMTSVRNAIRDMWIASREQITGFAPSKRKK